MRSRTKRYNRVISAFLVIMLCLATAFTAEAKITGVGKAARKSYVSDADGSQIIIYAGDSRVMYATCGEKSSAVRNNFAMCFVNGGNISVINIKKGKLTGMLKFYIEKYRSRKPVVIFNFGLNSNGKPAKNAKTIIKTYKKWMSAYPDIQFYVESIGPTKLSKGSYSNPNVIKLNYYLRAAFEPMGIWIDTYSYLVSNNLVNSSGKGLRDNYHFNWKTSKSILAMLRSHVEADLAAKAEAAKKAEEAKKKEEEAKKNAASTTSTAA